MRRARSLVAGVVVALALTGCSDPQPTEFSASQLEAPFSIKGGDLTTTDGSPFSFPADLHNRLSIVFFGYTKCPDICPAILGSLASGLLKLKEQDRSQVDVYFISTDPARDTDEVISRYLEHFDEAFIGLRGSIKAVSELGRTVGVFVDEGKELPTGGYDPNAHGTYLIGVEKSGSAPVVWDSNTTPSEFANDIRYMLNH